MVYIGSDDMSANHNLYYYSPLIIIWNDAKDRDCKNYSLLNF
jgi:hypothetical protein